MKKNLTPLGHARVYRDPRSGQLVVDTDTLRRSTFAGSDFAGGYDDFEGYDDEEFEGYDDGFEGYDDEEDEDDFGFLRRNPKRRRRRKQRRLGRRRERIGRRTNRKLGRLDKKEDKLSKDQDGVPSGWGATAVSDSEEITRGQGGSAALKIRLQHDFRAQDVTFTGSAAGALVNSIFFGDRAVWSRSDGIDAGVFAANGFMRGLLKGQSLKAGLDIIINGSLPGPGRFTATLIGLKPTHGGC
jgi:hypothetical protein